MFRTESEKRAFALVCAIGVCAFAALTLILPQLAIPGVTTSETVGWILGGAAAAGTALVFPVAYPDGRV